AAMPLPALTSRRGWGRFFFSRKTKGVFWGVGRGARSSQTAKTRGALRASGGGGAFFRVIDTDLRGPLFDRHAVTVRADAEAGPDKARAVPLTQQLLRLCFHFFFLAADEGNDVAENIEGRNAGIAGAGSGLHGDDEEFLQAESVGGRLENEDESGSGAIGISDDEARAIAAIFLLQRNGIEMRSVDLRNQQRDVGIHSMIFGVAYDRIAGTGEVFFGGARDGRVECGEDHVAIECRFEAFDDAIGHGGRNRFVELPLDGFGVSFAR